MKKVLFCLIRLISALLPILTFSLLPMLFKLVGTELVNWKHVAGGNYIINILVCLIELFMFIASLFVWADVWNITTKKEQD